MFRFLLIFFVLITLSANYVRGASINSENLSRQSSETLMEEGRKFFELRQGDKALECFLAVSERYKKGDRKEIENSIRALNNVGCVYKYLFYNYVEAYNYFNSAYELCLKEGYESFLPVIMVNMGDLLNDYGTFQDSDNISKQAESLFEKCFNLALKEKNWELLVTSFFNLCNFKYDIDLGKYKAIFREDIPDTTPDLKFVRLLYLGIESLQKKQYSESRQYFQQQIHVINTPWEANRDSISVYINIAHTYALENNFEKEAQELEKALEISQRSDLTDLTANICKELAECYGKIGNVDMQNKIRQLYLEKMEDIRNSRLSSIGEMKYLNDLKAQEEKSHQLISRQEKQRHIILWSLAILVLTIVIIMVVLIKIRRLHATSKKLYNEYQKLLQNDNSREETKYSKSNLNESKRENLVNNIKNVLENPEIICSQEFSSKELARMVGSNTTYVSQVINETFGISFSTLLGNYRVKEACRRINESDAYDGFTIEAIANSVGFKSRTAFLNAFKREVGLSPSEYIKMAKEARSERKEI